MHPRESPLASVGVLSTRGAALFASLIASLLASTSPATGQFDDVRQHIEQILVMDALPSIAVAVARDGEIIWEEGFGWADRENGIPATEHTMYSLASVTKPITATGLMVLVERGLVDLDRPVNDYLVDAKIVGRAGDASGATVRRLANHTSGLPAHDRYFYVDEPFGRPPMAETIRGYGFLATAPGERVGYSNLGYGILGHVISLVSGASYADFMREEVFLPLGMTRSSLGIDSVLEATQAQRYRRDGTPLPFYQSDTPAAMDVYSSAHDLIRFAMFHLANHLPDQEAILPDELIDRMATATGGGLGAEADPTAGAYGIGWALETAPGMPATFGHDGGTPGVTTSLVLLPEEEVAIVVLCNTNTDAVGTLIDMIQDVVLPASGEGVEPGADQPVQRPRPDPFEPEPDLIGIWRGQVEFDTGPQPIVLEIKPDGDVHVLVGDGRPDRAAGRLRTLVNEPRFRDGVFSGSLPPVPDADSPFRWQWVRGIRLTLRGRVLNGVLRILERSRHSTNRAEGGLSYWVELTREEVDPDVPEERAR